MNEVATISQNLTIELPLNNAFIAYCAGINPAEEWDIGGINGYKDASKTINFDCVDVFLNALKSGKNPARKHVLDFSLQLFSEYWAGKDIIEEYFSDTKFYFVIGPARSGGTYLLTQIYEAIGIDYSSISRAVVRDSIPGSKHLIRGKIQAKEEICAIFELCQFLAWSKQELNKSTIVQKNTCYVHWMPTLDKIFGRHAHYLVTARAPTPCIASFIQLGLGYNDWDELMSAWQQDCLEAPLELVLPTKSERLIAVYNSTITPKQNPTVADLLLINWKLHYEDIVHCRTRGEITVFEYGNPMFEFFAARHPTYLENNPTGLNWAPDTRDYLSFISTFKIDYDLINHVSDSVYKTWKDKNMDFPTFEPFSIKNANTV